MLVEFQHKAPSTTQINVLLYQRCNIFVPPPRLFVPSHLPCFPSITSSIRHSLKFFHTSSTPAGFSTTYAALVCTRSLKIPAVKSSLNFQTLHLFTNSILCLYNPSFRSKHTNDQFVIWNTLLLPNRLNISNQISFTLSKSTFFYFSARHNMETFQ